MISLGEGYIALRFIYNRTMSKPYVICFAGVSGCGKSSVAHYLSCELGIPAFERDKIRREVLDDLLMPDLSSDVAKKTFEERSEARIQKLFATKTSFVIDSSVDRRWGRLKNYLEANEYEWLLISFDLSDERMRLVYNLYHNSDPAEIPMYSKQHQEFLDEYGLDVDLTINDENFNDRLKLSLEAVRDFLLTI